MERRGSRALKAGSSPKHKHFRASFALHNSALISSVLATSTGFLPQPIAFGHSHATNPEQNLSPGPGPSLSFASMSAPCNSSSSAMESLPLSAAQCRAVQPQRGCTEAPSITHSILISWGLGAHDTFRPKAHLQPAAARESQRRSTRHELRATVPEKIGSTCSI